MTITSTAVLTFTGNDQRVIVRSVCDCGDGSGFNCGLIYWLVNGNSTLCIENIMFENCKFLGNFYIGSENAKNVIIKDCSFNNSLIPPFKSLNADNCSFQNVTFAIGYSTTKCTNCTFSTSYLVSTTLQFDAKFQSENCHIHSSSWDMGYVTVTIAGNSIISSSSSTFYVHSGSITLSGNVTFTNNTNIYGGAIELYSSTLNIAAGANVTFIDNRALAQGGAIFLSLSKVIVETGANLRFVNNSARDKGGAVYVHPGVTTMSSTEVFELKRDTDTAIVKYIYNCLFHSDNNNGIQFIENKATNGGDDIYGASLFACSIGTPIPGISTASSDPLRVCLCESPAKPLCSRDIPESETYNYADLGLEVYPGESFTIPISLVGVDYGTTTGVVYTNIIPSENSTNVKLDSNPESGQVISNHEQCTILNYSLSAVNTFSQIVTMYISLVNQDILGIYNFHRGLGQYCDKSHNYCYGPRLMPIFINITILPCPAGFTLNEHCDCYLHHKVFDVCTIVNGTGLFSWSNYTWVSIDNDGILYDTHCPFDYCNIVPGQLINLLNDSDTQCAFNRAGRLCGGCRENYSLAIGSSHCIQCPNNNNLALIIFFAAAGFILVFFITALNLTVSQGMVNGLVFYANIVWTYQSIFFPSHQAGSSVMIFFKVFIAWINLDFGFETCFIIGLTAFWKTWLQFIFPFYIWVIAGLIIVATKWSTKLTNLFNRAIHVLDTLFLLSYMKLLRLTVTTLEFSYLKYTDQNSTVTQSVVWSVDGTLSYLGYPHILLFLAGLATLVILCLPYTILLLLMQWLRRLPHTKLTNWIMKFHPVYDVYFAPFKHKHQYWFGVLLLARVVLLMTFVSAFAISQYVNLLVLLTVSVLLILYASASQPFKNTINMTIQNTFLANLALLAGFVAVSLRSNQPTLQTLAVGLSIGVAFVQFCGIVLYNVITAVKRRYQSDGCCNRSGDNIQEEDFIDNINFDRHLEETVKKGEAMPLVNSKSFHSKASTATY